MRLFATLVPAALLSACITVEPPAKTEGQDVKKEASPPAAEPAVIEFQAPLPEAEPPTPREAGPAWFDTAKIAHAKLLQPATQAKVGNSTATSMLLELEPGTTTADCMTNIRTEMAKTLGELAEASPGEKGRSTLQGKAEGYAYTVVCGPGKDGQTTLYLSYMDL